MEPPPLLVGPAPRSRLAGLRDGLRPLAATALVSGVVAMSIVLSARRTTTVVVPLPALVTVALPSPPAAPLVDEPAAANVPAPAVEPSAMVAHPRASAPTLDPACIPVRAEEPLPPTEEGPCSWDDGFPAISADGRLIAIKDYPDDGGRGYPSVVISFVDTRTSRQVRAVPLLLADELDVGPVEQLRARVDRRVAGMQRTLDAGRFRTLLPLSTETEGSGAEADAPSRIHAEIEDLAVRIVEPATSKVLWQRRLIAPTDPEPVHQDDDDVVECSVGHPSGVALWWDPSSRYVLAAISMVASCLCPNSTAYQVHRVP